MDAAEQLIQLSGSISDNNGPQKKAMAKLFIMVIMIRKKGRYRSISELYELTKPLTNLVNVVNYKRKMRAN
ncbi:uncharacterized protein Pyn_41205 [Prunus yedoensis var. nudiflora]|uniref:Uncharacterized protein n=1 Tax=Prunus yedoensis var. nudiflora TaxID=2094558 RepID=A0A314U991_PRUYE|nr:uncharacterized protein Pyn_41205 [Prunus yedoensis var. nudiflora]